MKPGHRALHAALFVSLAACAHGQEAAWIIQTIEAKQSPTGKASILSL